MGIFRIFVSINQYSQLIYLNFQLKVIINVTIIMKICLNLAIIFLDLVQNLQQKVTMDK